MILTLLLTGMLALAFYIQPVKTAPTTITVPNDYSTIQEAINNANEGDTIFVRNEIYHEHVIVNKTVSLIGENKNTTIIDGNQAGTVVTVTAENVSLNNFTIQNGEIGLEIASNGNTITSNIFSSNGAQETDLKTNLEVYPEPPSVPIWRFLYDLMDSNYTEFLDLTSDTPLLEVKVIGHSDVLELLVGLFYDENMDGTPQPNEYTGFASRDQVTWVTVPNPPKGRYIIKVQGWNVLGNPGHFDREISKFNGYGIGAHQTSNNTISRNLVIDNHAGVYLQSCSNTAVHTNNMTRNLGAIIVGDTVNSMFYDNKVFDNYGPICLRNSTNINVTKNILSSNSIGIHVWNSSSINVYKNELYSHGGWSIGFISSVDSKIADNNISTVTVLDGIRLMFSSRNNLVGNNISYCEHSGILYWYDCYNNSATDNDISLSGSLGWGHGHGVEVLLSHNNVFANNVAAFNSRNQGMLAIESTNNNFTGNLVYSNRRGIQLRSSFGNYVYHNNIINNSEQQGFDDTGENFWDDGYSSGGNYWSDYNGADVYRGPNQNELGSDGIGDTAYVIEDYNQDNYPLTKPYPWDPHDIGVTSITTSKTVVVQGYNLNITVTVFNYGMYTENLNITVYANATSIASQNVTLTSRNFATLTFTWNTSGFARAYILSANITILSEETNIADNTFVYGVVKVSCLGDVNGDYIVDGQDYQLVKNAVPSSLGSTNWNPNAELNDDGVIDGQDLQTVKRHIPSALP